MNFNKSVWILTVAMGLAACGGGDDTETEIKTTRYTAIDGYLSKAEVYVDKNKNGIAEAEEKAGVTDSNGQIDLPLDSAEFPVIVRVIEGQTLDSDYEGVAARSYEMIANVGRTVVTPFTTLMHLYGVTPSELVTQLDPDFILGLTEEMLTGDYIALAIGGEEGAIGAHILGRSVALALKDSLVANYDENGTATTQLENQITAVATVVQEQFGLAQNSAEGISSIKDMVAIVTVDDDGNIVDKIISSTSDVDVDSQVRLAINDTGVTQCYDAGVSIVRCESDLAIRGQDAFYGRDSQIDLNSHENGAVGFNFTKISGAGSRLAADATQWDCVQDNITGLMWEVKTPAGEGGLRDASYTYPWYNPDNSTNGGEPGTPGGDDCLNGSCDTTQYVSAINNAQLCGFNDWRLPNREELHSIVHYGGGTTLAGEECSYNAPCPSIDRVYFPHTQNSDYWTSTPKLFGEPRSYEGMVIIFNEGTGYRDRLEYEIDNGSHIRLVRSGQ